MPLSLALSHSVSIANCRAPLSQSLRQAYALSLSLVSHSPFLWYFSHLSCPPFLSSLCFHLSHLSRPLALSIPHLSSSFAFDLPPLLSHLSVLPSPSLITSLLFICAAVMVITHRSGLFSCPCYCLGRCYLIFFLISHHHCYRHVSVLTSISHHPSSLDTSSRSVFSSLSSRSRMRHPIIFTLPHLSLS